MIGKICRALFYAIAVVLALSTNIGAQDHTIDPGSPQVPVPYWASDIIDSFSGVVKYPAWTIDLSWFPFDNIDAFSYGTDYLGGPALNLIYSVDLGAVGVPGGVVSVEVNGAAGDKFHVRLCRNGISVIPIKWYDAVTCSLIPLPWQDNVDGLSTEINSPPDLYYSVDPFTAGGPADIYYQSPVGSGVSVLFATAPLLGLLPIDDIDALAVWDNPGAGTIGVFDPGLDSVYISLTCASPSAIPFGCASLISVSSGVPIPLYGGPAFDLLPNMVDNLDAINSHYFFYMPGDANMANGAWPPMVIGSDVTYLVNHFRSLANPCNLCGFYAAADVNGDCRVVGSDVTRLVSYFRGLALLSYCPDYPPAWLTAPTCPRPGSWPYCD